MPQNDDVAKVLERAEEIAKVDKQIPKIILLRGIDVDILDDC